MGETERLKAALRVNLTREQGAALRAAAKADGVTVSEYVRRVVKADLGKQE